MDIFYWMLAILIVMPITGPDLGSMSQPQVVPQDLMVQTGTDARFNCTAVTNVPVYWRRITYGSATEEAIYEGVELLVGIFGTSGRFAVVDNDNLKRYDLVINNTTLSDSGVYLCIDDRGVGKKTGAQLVVYDRPNCQGGSSQTSYMGCNVFDLNPDIIRFSCGMNYSGNIHVSHFVWSVGVNKFNGTTEVASGIASSSLDLVAISIFNHSRVTWEAVFLHSSDETVGREILWESKPLQMHFSEWSNKAAVKECVLNCNPPCTSERESLANGSQCCRVNYSTGNELHQGRFCVDTVSSSEAAGSSKYYIAAIVILGGLLLVTWIGVGCFFIKIHWPMRSRFRSTLNTEAENQNTSEMVALQTRMQQAQ